MKKGPALFLAVGAHAALLGCAPKRASALPAELPQNIPDPQTADVFLTATIRAGEIEWQVVPDGGTRVVARPSGRTHDSTERINLPRPVQANVPYRNVEVRWTVVSDLSSADEIFADAGVTQ